MQRFEIRIDSILQGKIGDDGASHHTGKIPARDHLDIAALLVQHQQDELFGQAYRKLVLHALIHPARIEKEESGCIRARAGGGEHSAFG